MSYLLAAYGISIALIGGYAYQLTRRLRAARRRVREIADPG